MTRSMTRPSPTSVATRARAFQGGSGWAALLALLFLVSPAGAQGVMQLVSLSHQGDPAQGLGFDMGRAPMVSSNGRFVAFESQATNLVPGITTSVSRIYVRDLHTGSTELIAPGHLPSTSWDARYIAFHADGQVYVHDRQAGITELASRNASGQPGNAQSHSSYISLFGRYVVFYSQATNLVGGTTFGTEQAYWRDLLTGAIKRVSSNASGVASNAACGGLEERPSITMDGRWIAFRSLGSNLVPGVSGAVERIYVKNHESGEIRLVSVDSSGQPLGFESYNPFLSANPRYVVFGHSGQILLHDMVTGSTTLQSEQDGVPMSGFFISPSISLDRRYIAFSGSGGTPNQQVFLRHRQSGVVTRVSSSPAGAPGNSESFGATMSGNAELVAFQSFATNLTPHSLPAGLKFQAFLWNGNCYFDVASYCASQTSSTGCNPRIEWWGIPSASHSLDFAVMCRSVPPGASARFIYSTTGSQALPWGAAGTLCLRDPMRATPLQVATSGTGGACSGSLLFNFNFHAASGVDAGLFAGRTVWGQWFVADPGTPGGYVLSDAIRFTLCL